LTVRIEAGNTVATDMTTANKITIGRILLVPLFVVEVLNYVGHGRELHRFLAICAFLAAAVCDGVDGYIARRYNQRSELGAILDPLGDKLLLVAGIVLLSLHHEQYLPHLPLWLTATVISRDMLLLVGLAVVYYACGKVIVKPHLIGKVATVLQMVAVCWALLKLSMDWLHWFAVGAAICTGVSGVIYVFDGVRQLSASPASSPAPEQ
jgi:cardiolipin synthase (CMP-forming)